MPTLGGRSRIRALAGRVLAASWHAPMNGRAIATSAWRCCRDGYGRLAGCVTSFCWGVPARSAPRLWRWSGSTPDSSGSSDWRLAVLRSPCWPGRCWIPAPVRSGSAKRRAYKTFSSRSTPKPASEAGRAGTCGCRRSWPGPTRPRRSPGCPATSSSTGSPVPADSRPLSPRWRPAASWRWRTRSHW